MRASRCYSKPCPPRRAHATRCGRPVFDERSPYSNLRSCTEGSTDELRYVTDVPCVSYLFLPSYLRTHGAHQGATNLLLRSSPITCPCLLPIMSAAVMSNFYFPSLDHEHGQLADSQLRVQNWMLGQMAQYPPPPQAEQHYPTLYSASAGAQQLVDQQQQLQYSSLNQPLYPKTDGSAPSEQTNSTHQMHSLAHDLQQHTHLNDQQRHQHPQNPIHLHRQGSLGTPPPGQQALPPLNQPQQGTPDAGQKNRLRKACDSCSIRKVKVCLLVVITFVLMLTIAV